MFDLSSLWEFSPKRFQVCVAVDDLGRAAGRGAKSIKVIMVRCMNMNMNMNRNRNTVAEVMKMRAI